MKRSWFYLYFVTGNLLAFFLLAPLVIFYGPFQSIKLLAVETIISSRHPQVAEFFLDKKTISELTEVHREKTVIVEPVIAHKDFMIDDRENGLKIEGIRGKAFQGKVMLVANPKQVKAAVTGELGIAGQRLSQLVAVRGAIAGINGGGFSDPNARGNGAFPQGITVLDGKLIHKDGGSPANMIGFDASGKLVLGTLAAPEISKLKIEQGVTFYPNLILDGIPQIEGDGGWGLAPRTGIGQRADGTVILVVIDGRQPGWSMGATLRDLMNLFIEYRAVNAANLDGGSSTEMVYNGQIINSLWNIYGERYIPTAFIVMPSCSIF